MTPEYLRLIIGLGVMSAACLTSYRLGDRPVRLAACIIAGSWAVAFGVQRLTGLEAEPAIASELTIGLGLLYLASFYNRGWLWAEVALESVLLCMHAWSYGNSETPPSAQVVGNNALAVAGLVVLVGAALRSRRLATGDEEA